MSRTLDARKAGLARTRMEQRIARLTVILPSLATLVALAGVLTGIARPSAFELALTASMYVFTVLGVTVGFHRLLTHRSFAVPDRVRGVFTILGCMGAQGPPLYWVAVHRAHHRFSDTAYDPHSPHAPATSSENPAALPRQNGLAHFWHAHIGWMFEPLPANWPSYVPDLLRDRALLATGQAYPLWLAAGIAGPALAAGLWHRSLFAAAVGALWAGPVRIFLVHHATWSVNSVCHLFGERTFATRDHSRNNRIVACLTAGEGWHNNHHAFPYSARHGLMRWQIDPSYAVIRVLAAMRLASRIKTPPREHIARMLQLGGGEPHHDIDADGGSI